jgi:hypothetical protein
MSINEIPNIKKIAKRYQKLQDLSCCAASVEDEMILDGQSGELVSVIMVILGYEPFDESNRGLLCAELDQIASRM